MSIINFSDNVHVNILDFNDAIVHYFDELMALYALVGKYENIQIDANTNNSCISFNIILESEENASFIKNIIEAQEISKYGHTYVPSVSQDKKILNIQLNDRRKGCE